MSNQPIKIETLLNQWPLTIVLSLLTLIVCVLITVIGGDIESLRLALWLSARLAMLFFLAAFAASSLCQLWPHPLSRWLRRNRRYLGVSFAVVFTIHALGIGYRTLIDPEFAASLETGAVKHGAFFLLLCLVMAITSNSYARKRLGIVWSLLHSVGSYYIFLIFYVTETMRVKEEFWPYGIYFILMSAIILLRLIRSIVRLHSQFIARAA